MQAVHTETMTLATKITFIRVILSPAFFIIYLLPGFFPAWFTQPQSAAWTVPVLWLIFITAELTDMFDGMAARKRNEVSDFGKLFDPFADTLMQITCFLCFVIDRIFPAVLFLLVLYREFSILFIRNLMLKKGVAMGARLGGKIKTVTYIIAGGSALLTASLRRLARFEFLYPWFKTGATVIFGISVIFSLVSFCDYLSVYRKPEKSAPENQTV
jgi:CDP-diacylglycerol--glycerol-3-phosphate 3-phosphatidyltransferase